MFSRYDLMRGSANQIDTDGEVWPDPLTVDYTSFTLTQAPYSFLPEDRLQKYPYLVTYAFYKQTQYEDIVFSINGVPHLSKVQTFPSISFPVFSDLLQFFGQETV